MPSLDGPTTAAECLAHLERRIHQIDRILELWPPDGQPPIEKVAQIVQVWFRELRGGLDDDLYRLASDRRTVGLSEVEETMLLPAMEAARARLTVRLTSMPSTLWYAEIRAARRALDRYAGYLRHTRDAR